MSVTRRFAIVPAAGGGTRAGVALPKQYHQILGKPILAHTLDRLAGALALDGVLVALAPDDVRYAGAIGPRPGVEPLPCGGTTRARTVTNAMAVLASRCGPDDWILVHDAARPCVPVESLRRLVEAVGNDPVGGLLAMPVADTLKRGDGDAEPRVARTEGRERLWQAQTPQMFRHGVLARAYAAPDAADATDDAQAVERLAARGGCRMPRLVPGSRANLKITWPEDFALAAAILAAQARERA
ncbi:2-C-methyl-D-erythritol 4-phosphate cytidylyltransferase [Burkholderiales bacterium]|nr:2-C-methyl-D-erythritol 4-phosphate cytidylyltransferase [Burkholderiales bacterium]